MSTLTIRSCELLDAPPEALPWLPTFACAVAAAVVATLTCPDPSRVLTPGMAVFRAALSVVLTAGITAMVARVTFTAFFPVTDQRLGAAALAYAGLASWFAPLAVFVAQDRSGAVLGAGLLGLAAGRLLRRSGGDGDSAPMVSSPMFTAFPPVAPPAFAFAAAIALEAGVLALILEQVMPAAVLTGTGCFFAAAEGPSPRGPQRCFRVGTDLALPVFCAITLAAVGLIRLSDPAPGRRGSRLPGAAFESRADPADKDLFSGVILLSELSLKLMAPLPRPPVPGSARRAAPPPAIVFSGEYWIYPINLPRPPEGSLVERATPLTYNFTAVDRSALIMEARQRLPSSIDPRCCSALEVVVRNADPKPETITLRVSLASSLHPGRRYRQLLGVRLLPAEKQAVLRFPIRAQSVLPRFDLIVVEFDLGSPRMHRSANVAIQRFAFLPRAGRL